MDPIIGEIRMFGGDFAPEGWLLCNGQSLSSDPNGPFAALFALIGTTYGGDGTQTFAVPDLRGRVPVSAGQAPGLANYTLGETGGSETVALSTNQMPAHNHALIVATNDATSPTPGPDMLPATTAATFKPYNSVSLAAGSVASFAKAAVSANTPSGGAHENHMPSLGINFIIAVVGIYPQQ